MKKIAPPELAFDWININSTMLCFRVRNDKTSPANAAKHYQIPTSGEANALLEQMVHATWTSFKNTDGTVKSLRRYELSELYAGKEQLFAEHDNVTLAHAAELLKLPTLPTVTAKNLRGILDSMELYFAVFHDHSGNKMVACKQSRMVKKNLRQSDRFLCFGGGTLRPLTEPIFSLDEVFDYLICEEGVFILRPTQFTQTTVGSAALRSAMVQVAPKLADRIKFVSFDAIARYVGNSTQGAKLLASIKDKPQLDFLTEKKLRTDLKKQKVPIETIDGRVGPAKGSELHFLHYLDFRLFGYEWKKGSPEYLVARARVTRAESSDEESSASG